MQLSDQLVVDSLIALLGIAIGGGLYETLAVYPGWHHDPAPATLTDKLRASGQAAASRKFWPFISPTLLFLAIWNFVLALHASGELRLLWVAAGGGIVAKSIASYVYFVPTMMRKFERSRIQSPSELTKAVRRWTALSPLRLGHRGSCIVLRTVGLRASGRAVILEA
jgi:hypothetical protein